MMVKVAACGLILFFGIINYFGIKPGAITVNIFTLSKLLPLTFFVVIGLLHLKGAHFKNALEINLTHFGSAIFLCLWPLQGFETAPVAAGETKNPKPDIPIATIGSLLFVIVFYTLIQVVAVGTLSGLSEAKKPLADAAATFLGPWGATFLALGAVISMTGYCSGNALGSPRFLQALAEDRCLPVSLSTPHAQYMTPWRSILLTTGLATIMAFILNFEALVDLSNMAVISQYLSTCIAVIWLRYRRPTLERPFKIPLGSFIPVIGCAVSLWLIQQVKMPEVIFAGITLLVGFIFWGIYNVYLQRKMASN